MRFFSGDILLDYLKQGLFPMSEDVFSGGDLSCGWFSENQENSAENAILDSTLNVLLLSVHCLVGRGT